MSAASEQVIDLTWLSRLHAAAAWADRLVYGSALGLFLAVYFFLAIPSDYDVQPSWLLVQPIVLAAGIVAWRAAGHAIRPLKLIALALLVLFAGGFVDIAARLAHSREAINAYSQSFPDPRWHALATKLGPDGPFIVFACVLASVMLVLVTGAAAAMILRFLRVGGTGATLIGLDRRVRREIAKSGDAPSLIRLIDGWRWKGWIAGLGAFVVLLLPLLLSGREREIPGASGLAGWLPDKVARAVTFFNDRAWAAGLAVLVAALLWRLARWYASPTAQFVLAADQRPPILLLRSFQDDHAAVAPAAVWRKLLHPLLWPARALMAANGAIGWAVALNAITRRRLEEVAARSLRDAGPFIAVGDRGEKPPELGAFRATLADDEWQEYVRCWMRAARIVVMVAGRTPSVQWELRTAADLGVLGKVILLMPPGSAEDTAERWRLVVGCLADTPWHYGLVRTDPKRLVAVRFAEAGRVATMRSAGRGERDYDLSVRIGTAMVVG